MDTDKELESKVISRFISKEKRERFLDFVYNKVNRIKFIDELAHFKHLNLDEFELVTKADVAILQRKLAEFEDCYVISENKHIDARRLNTNNALEQVVGYGMGTLLIFGNADKVYYEGEGINDRWISKRK